MKILVMKFRNIGDVLLTSPIASALSEMPEKPHLTFLVKNGTQDMLTLHPDIHEVLVLPEKKSKEASLAFLLRQISFIQSIRKSNFDISINTTEGDRGTILGWLSGAKRRIGYLKIGDKWWRRKMITEGHYGRHGLYHTVIRNLDLISKISEYNNNIKVDFYFSLDDKLYVENLLSEKGWDKRQKIVHIHPVSRWFFKCWRDDYMAEVIDYIQNNLGFLVVLSCAPDKKEKEKLFSILNYCKTKPINLGGSLALKQTGALSNLATLFFGVDSAPMHMAAAVGTPTIGLFGPSGAFDWGPWPNTWNNIEDNPYKNRNGVQYVESHVAIQQDWKCAPCGQAGCDGSRKSRCLDEMPVSTVTTILKQKLQEI